MGEPGTREPVLDFVVPEKFADLFALPAISALVECRSIVNQDHGACTTGTTEGKTESILYEARAMASARRPPNQKGESMSEQVKLKASDGHELDAYVAKPKGKPLGGLVVIQEIFGVNRHICSVSDKFAAEGFLAVAPAIFDRVEKNVDLGYEGADMQKAAGLMQKLKIDDAIKDVEAALAYAQKATGKPAEVVGYCYGGTLAWLTATRLKPAAVVGYYGGQIAKFAGENPHVPVLLHFGRQDAHIPETDVAAVQAAHPEVEVYWYDAGHGFNCDLRGSYNEAAAKPAFERSLAFLKKNLAS
jgi:carboxymethylenebutenolidase